MNPASRDWNREALAGLSGLRPSEAGYDAYTGDAVYEGHPDLVLRPRSGAEIARLLRETHPHGIPVTAAGGQSSLTGSSAANEGILLATEGMNRILDLDRDPRTGGMVAVVEPGIFLGDFQRELEAQGWMYPPDPTSRNEARLGATVATNATGEDTLLYGPTRRWVRELEVITAPGERITLRRTPGFVPPEEKATAGYYHWGDPLDLFIGSEGTLGIITRLVVDVVPKPPGILAGMAFFPSTSSALRFVVAARRSPGLTPRALELFDGPALSLVRDNAERVVWPDETGAAVYFKQEFLDDGDRDARLTAWFELIERELAEAHALHLLDAVLVVDDGPGRERLRTFRHRLPASLHERVAPFREEGGGKIGSDWWVPYDQLGEMLVAWEPRMAGSGLDIVIFGHVGNGHPHVNFLTRNREETARARGIIHAMCAEAVRRGGGVAGEHGLGKLKHDLLELQYPDGLSTMVAVKREWDPRWTLGRGNLFSPR